MNSAAGQARTARWDPSEAYCLQAQEACRQLAGAAAKSEEKAFWLEIAGRWVSVAQSDLLRICP
jgi:hypothetical protein